MRSARSPTFPNYIKRVKAGEIKLMGFGHRVYKNYDPRARIIKEVADQVFEVTGRNSKIDIALELERIALSDDYFVTRKLYPNVDFYSGIIYQAMGFGPEMFTVLFAIPRTAGWLAQWNELMATPSRRSRVRARSTSARGSVRLRPTASRRTPLPSSIRKPWSQDSAARLQGMTSGCFASRSTRSLQQGLLPDAVA